MEILKSINDDMVNICELICKFFEKLHQRNYLSVYFLSRALYNTISVETLSVL